MMNRRQEKNVSVSHRFLLGVKFRKPALLIPYTEELVQQLSDSSRNRTHTRQIM